LRGFNGADARLARLADERRIHHALVFVRACPQWQCYGTVFWRNSPRLDGDIVWARDLGPVSDAALLAAFPGRRPYLADYGLPAIEPLSQVISSLASTRLKTWLRDAGRSERAQCRAMQRSLCQTR
jgi:hypothetical protein